MSPRRARLLLALLCCSSIFVCTSVAYAIPESQIRKLVKDAKDFETQGQWEEAREIYEALLGQPELDLGIRARYHEAQRRCWQIRRHQDISYRKEVLSVDYGQALRMCRIINRTLLDQSIDKKKLDPTKLFRKGLEELDAALANRAFVNEYIPAEKQANVAAFRALLAKSWGDAPKLSREDAVKQIEAVAMAAEKYLDLSATVVAMEFACGACYAIDEYTVYLTPNQLRELAQSLSRNDAIGVGLVLGIRDSMVVIQDVVMGSAAFGKIAIGDQIISVNNKGVADLPINIVRELLDGPVGSMVDLEVLSPGDANARMVRLERRRATLSVFTPVQVTETIWLLKVSGFTDTTVQEIDEAIGRMTEFGMKALILDLRDNNGGVFESAIDTARRFLERGIITSTLNQDTKANVVYHAKNQNALRVPIAVLVNGETASAAEVLAGALKDNNRAILVGQTTFGKGCVQTVLKLPNATGGVPTGGMKLTTARFFSPKGLPYSGRGILPHFMIDDAMPVSQMMVDPFIAKAREELERGMMMPK